MAMLKSWPVSEHIAVRPTASGTGYTSRKNGPAMSGNACPVAPEVTAATKTPAPIVKGPTMVRPSRLPSVRDDCGNGRSSPIGAAGVDRIPFGPPLFEKPARGVRARKQSRDAAIPRLQVRHGGELAVQLGTLTPLSDCQVH